MAKTRSQTVIKKEEEDHKDILLLHSVNSTAGNSGKITKRKASRNRSIAVPGREVKVEETTDAKPLLEATPTISTLGKTPYISQEQIKQLIRYVVNDKMSVLKASKKANVSYDKARHYYNAYKNDPEKKIPVPKDNRNICTREQITTPIASTVDDGMTLLEASAKANMYHGTGRTYYRKYKENQNLDIRATPTQRLMQERITKLIGYLADGKTTVKAASAKANMDYATARKYYHKYLNDPNHDIPASDLQGQGGTFPIQDQINKLITYIVIDKISVRAAAKKAKLPESTALNYYQRYKNDPNHRIPVACKSMGPRAIILQDKIKQFIGYITEDKMTVKAASRKAKMCVDSGRKYFRKYRNDPNSIINTPNQGGIYTQEQIIKLISFIVDDKMTVRDASQKADMSLKTGETYYQQYLNDLHRDIPTPTHVRSRAPCTQEQINNMIHYVVEDKMSIAAASKKANMCNDTGYKYYKRYLRDPSNEVPTHVRNRALCTQEQINNMIRYVVEDKMSIPAASKKANMCNNTGYKYYKRYLKDRQLSLPAHGVL